ncbi:MAG: ABC transporter permease [Actinomycetota bacterium]|nr:ABC transporter permease [Actinomycetota bacterium]
MRERKGRGGAIRDFLTHRAAVLALSLLIIIMTAALFAPLIAPLEEAVGFNPELVKEAPSAAHIMGTDDLGRDIFARVIWGSRVSLRIGFLTMALAMTLGVISGSVAGYRAGLIDSFMMRLADMIYAFPTLLGAITIIYIVGPGIINIVVVLAVFEWANVTRIFRASVISTKEKGFIEAAKCLGLSEARIIIRHIIPNSIGVAIAYSAVCAGAAIMDEAALSFLGLGIQPPHPSLGSMLFDARPYITTAPWMAVFPGLFIFIMVTSLFLISDGLKPVFGIDPKFEGEDKSA